ncbi:MAG: TolC family protein, partial [Bacteroidota bacterium]
MNNHLHIFHLSRYSRLCCLVIALMLANLGLQAQSEGMNLQQAIDYALANHPDIQDAQLNIQDAEVQIRENLATGLPQITGSGQYQYYFEVPVVPLPPEFTGGGDPQEVSFVLRNNLTGGINLNTMIFNASYFVGLRAARASRSYAQLELSEQKRQVTQQVRDAYLPLLLINSNLIQLDKNIASIEKLFQATQATYEEGFIEQLDVDRLELTLLNLQTERENLDRQYDMAEEFLRFTLNYPATETLEIEDDLDAILADTNDDLIVTKLDYNLLPGMGLFDQAVALNGLNVELSKSRRLPSLAGFAGYQYQYQGNDFSSGFWAPTGFLGVSLNVPIYDGGYNKSLIQRAEIAQEQIVLQRETYRRALDLDAKNARIAYQNAQDRLADRDRNLALAQRIYDTTK